MGASDNRDHTLTPQAKRLLQEIIEDWSSEGFLRGPQIGTDALTEGVEWLYSMSSLPRPQVIVIDSPLGCQLELQALQNVGEDMQTVEVNVWPSIDFKMWSALWWKVMGEFLNYPHASGRTYSDEELDNWLADLSEQEIQALEGKLRLGRYEDTFPRARHSALEDVFYLVQTANWHLKRDGHTREWLENIAFHMYHFQAALRKAQEFAGEIEKRTGISGEELDRE